MSENIRPFLNSKVGDVVYSVKFSEGIVYNPSYELSLLKGVDMITERILIVDFGYKGHCLQYYDYQGHHIEYGSDVKNDRTTIDLHLINHE